MCPPGGSCEQTTVERHGRVDWSLYDAVVITAGNGEAGNGFLGQGAALASWRSHWGGGMLGLVQGVHCSFTQSSAATRMPTFSVCTQSVASGNVPHP